MLKKNKQNHTASDSAKRFILIKASQFENFQKKIDESELISSDLTHLRYFEVFMFRYGAHCERERGPANFKWIFL